MAMRKEPERRYGSVAQFSEDIHRHLNGLPVRARTDTFGYRAGKFIRRQKFAVAATAVIALHCRLGSSLLFGKRELRAQNVPELNVALTRSGSLRIRSCSKCTTRL